MISSIIQLLLSVVLIVFSIKIFIKGYKDAKNEFEQVLYIVLSIAIMFPLVIYYLDRYNIPSRLGYTENINSSEWVSILMNYSAAIITAIIGAIFLVYVTFKQMNETYRDNIKLNNETQRIQNMPFLNYNFTHEKINEKLFGEKQKWIFSNHDAGNSDSIDFTMEVENIGLNAVRKIYLEVESELFNKKEIFELCNQSNIDKNEIKKKEFIITNVSKGTYKIEIIVYYQDLLKNWYKQKIHLTISVTNVYDSKTCSNNQINSIIVDDEERLLRKPNFINKK